MVQLGPRYGSIPSIVPEVMFPPASPRAPSHPPSAPTVEIGAIRPPKGIEVLDPWGIPFPNTPIPLPPGAAVTRAYHAILAGFKREAVYALVVTTWLAPVPTGP